MVIDSHEHIMFPIKMQLDKMDAAVCFFPRQAGRPDKGNCLESGEIRGNMLTRRFGFPTYRINFVPWEEAGVFA